MVDEPKPDEVEVQPAEDNVVPAGADDVVESGREPRIVRLGQAVDWLAAGPWRWATTIGATLVFVAGVGVATYRTVRPGATPTPTARAVSSAGSSSSAPTPSTGAGVPWPTAVTACGDQTFLPILTPVDPLTERTGVRLTVGNRPRSVDIDPANVRPLTGVTLVADEFVSQLATDPAGTVALIQPCNQKAPTRVIRIAAGRPAGKVASGRIAALLGGGNHVWGIQYATDPNGGITDGPISLNPLNGRRSVVLPSGLQPLGAYRDLIIGYEPDASSPTRAAALVLLDPATRRMRPFARIGSAAATAVGPNAVVWTDGPCPARRPCPVHQYDLATGRTFTFELALPAGTDIGYGLVSPDGRLLAFARHRPAPDPRYLEGHPGTPSDIAVLHVETGQLDVIPGIELWAKSSPSLVFSADSRWLVISLNAGTHGTLRLWRPGLVDPLAAPVEIPGPTLYNSNSPITLVR